MVEAHEAHYNPVGYMGRRDIDDIDKRTLTLETKLYYVPTPPLVIALTLTAWAKAAGSKPISQCAALSLVRMAQTGESLAMPRQKKLKN